MENVNAVPWGKVTAIAGSLLAIFLTLQRRFIEGRLNRLTSLPK